MITTEVEIEIDPYEHGYIHEDDALEYCEEHGLVSYDQEAINSRYKKYVQRAFDSANSVYYYKAVALAEFCTVEDTTDELGKLKNFMEFKGKLNQ